MDLNHLDARVQAECHLRREDLLVVAVSGGPDSLALLHTLHTLQYCILPVHFDHLLRPSSSEEADLLADKVGKWGYSLICGQGDVRSYAISEHLSTEDAARILRYRFLFQQAEGHHAAAVLTAHTADDQVETVLMHILRGTGVKGLAGMTMHQLPNAWSDHIPLVRPLLDLTRSEIMTYCDEQQLDPFIDETNTDPRYVRNRIRNHLLPMLEEHYNPRIRQSILRLAQTVQDELDISGNVLEVAWQKCLKHDGVGYLAFHLDRLKEESPAVQRLILRKAIRQLVADDEVISLDVVERGVEFLKETPHGKEIQLVQGVSIIRARDEVIIGMIGPTKPSTEQFASSAWLADYPRIDRETVLQPGGSIQMANGWKICASRPRPWSNTLSNVVQPDVNMICIDTDRLDGPVVVRSYRSGERIQPYGMNGKSIKISDLLTNEKIPRLARAGYPVIVCGDQVVWVPGCRMGHAFRITAETTSCLQLRLKKSG